MDTEPLTLPRGLTVAEFIRWADRQPGDARFELHDGQVVEVAPETVGHARLKLRIAIALQAAIEAAGLPCEAIVDGPGVRTSDRTLLIPDATVRCGTPAGNDLREIPEPLIVVEVASPSTERVDATLKRTAYFGLPSVAHYLIVKPASREVHHHRRLPDGQLVSDTVGNEPLRLDPPGILLGSLFD